MYKMVCENVFFSNTRETNPAIFPIQIKYKLVSEIGHRLNNKHISFSTPPPPKNNSTYSSKPGAWSLSFSIVFGT